MTRLGSGVLHLAVMNLFFLYGLLSALMIVFAFLTAITMLPVLLMFLDRNDCEYKPAGGKF